MEEDTYLPGSTFLHHVPALDNKMFGPAATPTTMTGVPEGTGGSPHGLEEAMSESQLVRLQKCVSMGTSHYGDDSSRLSVHCCLAGQPHASHDFALHRPLQNC